MAAEDRRVVEGVVERRIREAAERGDFERLPGAGRPLRNLGDTYDPAWWTKAWVRRQRLLTEAEDLRAERRSLRARAVVDPAAARRLEAVHDRLGVIDAELGADGDHGE
ncbi:MAG: DUF1992 domain-containing protein [Acidimicrobiia bacterium]|nr:DUF1992 domain-containing protein [Acidimicrobiia bacterium]